MELINDKKRLPRRAVLTLIWVGPVLALELFWRLAFHLYLTALSWLLLVLIPGLCVTRLIYLFRRCRQRAVRKGWVVFLISVLYLALIPVDESESEEYVILRVETDENNEEILVSIDDDEEFDRIADIFDDEFFSETDYDAQP